MILLYSYDPFLSITVGPFPYTISPPPFLNSAKYSNIMYFVQTVKAFVPSMMKRDHGHIVTISSMLGLMGLCGAADYCASKFAITGMTEALRYEILSERKDDIHVTSVHPFLINTDMFAGIRTR